MEWRGVQVNCGRKVRYSMGQGHRSPGGGEVERERKIRYSVGGRDSRKREVCCGKR